MLTSIIILTYNQLDYTKKCIDSIRKYTTKNSYEIIIVDNNSTDGTVKWLKFQKDIRVIYNNENLGFPKGCNQGIVAAKGDNILLLNNDTVVTHNWLENLIKCLYSSDDIGAVGPVTNNCSNFQAISIPYTNNDLEKMHEFAKKYNISNSEKWEERLRLIGFCYLVKKHVVDKVGLLDEIFTPGNFEDDDFSLRIRNQGYRIMLCKDTFIHHYGSVSFSNSPNSFNDILHINRLKFKEKWNVAPVHLIEIRKDITSKVIDTNIDSPTILHIGCQCGGTLLDIKNKLPNSILYGIESREKYIRNTDHFAKICVGDLKILNQFKENYFDSIIMTIYKKEIDYYFETLSYLKKFLKNSGRIIITMPLEFDINDIYVKNKLNNIFNNLSYEISKKANHKLVYFKNDISQSNLHNNKKICFICCFIDEKMYVKSLSYIKKLEIPKGYEIEFIYKKDAQSITKAYNEAINYTDAKYKVYMHQDVFITNKNFIKDILNIFQTNKKIGMIGVAGSKDVPLNGIWWESNETYGKVIDNHTGEFQLLKFNQPKNNYESVSIIDGLIMITQYDIPWRDDIFAGWHFIDVSQSMEFIKAGYEVVIPKQGFPWCIHDCGAIYVDNEYEKCRKTFIKEYLD